MWGDPGDDIPSPRGSLQFIVAPKIKEEVDLYQGYKYITKY